MDYFRGLANPSSAKKPKTLEEGHDRLRGGIPL